MRNLKKLLAVIVAVCTILTFAVPAFAADATLSADTQACKTIGMLVGQDANGVTTAYEATNPTRIQAAVMLLRLKGALADAQAYTGTTNFVDADKANWAKPIMAYLKDHPEFGYQGIGGDKFDPTGLITAQQYYKVILTALGYTVKDSAGVGDYAYADTLTFAKDTAKLAVAGNVENFTIGNLATATVEVLKATVKGGTTTLAASLVAAGKLDAAAAETAGVYASKISATAAQTGAKTITVTFNRALTATEKTAATFDVKNGLVAYTVKATWTTDNKSVALAYEYNLFAGDYTITIGGIADPVKVTVADEKVAKIAINNGYLPLNDSVAVDYTVYNQFDEKMENVSLSDLAFSAFNATKGFGVVDQDDAGLAVDLLANHAVPAQASAKDDTIILTITHKSGVNVTKSVKVSDVAAPKTLAFSAVQPLTGKVRITEGETLVLPYTFTDQYGNAYKLPEYNVADFDGNANSELIGQVLFTTSDSAVVNPDTFTVDADGVLSFDATGDGTAVISAIVPATGIVATVSIKIEATSAVKTFTMSNPGKLVAATESIVIPYAATDTFGGAIAQKDFDGTKQGDVSFVSSKPSIVNATSGIKFNGKHELEVTTLTSGSVTIYGYVGGVLQNSVTLDVKALAIPTRVTGLTDVPLLFQDTAAATAQGTIEMKNVKVIDQYNRPIDLGDYTYDVAGTPTTFTYTVEVGIDGAAAGHVTINNPSVTDVSTNTALVDGSVGTEKLKFELTKTDGVTPTVVSTYKTSAKTISTDDIVGYAIDTVPTLYGFDTNAAGDPHAKAITVVGKDVAGNKVTIDQAAIVSAITSSNTAIVGTDLATMSVFALKAGTATIAVWKTGTKIAEATVTAKDEAPYAAAAKFDPTSATLSLTGTTTVNLAGTLEVKDQYDTVYTDAGTYTSSDAAVASVSTVGLVTANAVGSATITYITSTGIAVTVDVTVNP